MSKHDGYCAMGVDGRYANLQCECDFIGLVREDQNERIIKLLEAMAEECESGDCNCLGARDMIELIKGDL